MSIFESVLIFFTGAMGVLTATLYGILLLTNVCKLNYEVAGRISFLFSFLSILVLLALSGSAIATVCTWMSGICTVLLGAWLVSLLQRAMKARY